MKSLRTRVIEGMDLCERELSLVQAGIDEHGQPWLIVAPTELTDPQREAFAALFMEAAAGLLGGSVGGVVH